MQYNDLAATGRLCEALGIEHDPKRNFNATVNMLCENYGMSKAALMRCITLGLGNKTIQLKELSCSSNFKDTVYDDTLRSIIKVFRTLQDMPEEEKATIITHWESPTRRAQRISDIVIAKYTAPDKVKDLLKLPRKYISVQEAKAILEERLHLAPSDDSFFKLVHKQFEREGINITQGQRCIASGLRHPCSYSELTGRGIYAQKIRQALVDDIANIIQISQTVTPAERKDLHKEAGTDHQDDPSYAQYRADAIIARCLAMEKDSPPPSVAMRQ